MAYHRCAFGLVAHAYADAHRQGAPKHQAMQPLRENCMSWILDGRAFIIRRKDELVKKFLTVFFRQTKFPSFTRKLYRWGFRQVSIPPVQIHSDNKREMIFGHEFFQRDNQALMGRMRSVTAAGKEESHSSHVWHGTLRTMRDMALQRLEIEPKDAHGSDYPCSHWPLVTATCFFPAFCVPSYTGVSVCQECGCWFTLTPPP